MARDIRVVFTGNADDLLKAAAESDLALESVDRTAKSSGKSWASWGTMLTRVVPILAAVGVGVLGLTGNLGALSALMPLLTTGLGLLLAPLTTLAAILVALVGPVTVLVGLLGALGAGFFFAAKAAFGKGGGLAGQLQVLEHQFKNLTSALAGDFMPIFRFLISSAHDALTYLNQIAHLPLDKAFHSLATTGVAGLTKFLEKIGHIVANPIRLAFQFALGGPGQGASNALGSLFNQVKRFFTTAPPGGKISIDQMFINWFNEHDFSKTGLRWGMELAGAVLQGLGNALRSGLGSRGIGFAGGGAVIGAAIGGPLGAGIGAAAGVALNHYWPQIVATAKQVWSTVKTFAVSEFHAITTALEHFLGPTTWSNLGTIAKQTWSTVKTVAVNAFHAIVAVAKTIWDVFNTIVIKTGAWKAGLALVKGAIYVLTSVIAPVVSAIGHAVRAATRLANHFNGIVLSAIQAVAGVVAAIVSGIEAAIADAVKLAKALDAINPFHGGNTNPAGNPGAGSGRGLGSHGPNVVHVHIHSPAVIGNNEIDRVIRQAVTRITRNGQPALAPGRVLR